MSAAPLEAGGGYQSVGKKIDLNQKTLKNNRASTKLRKHFGLCARNTPET
jgi:hypothetical protein